MAAPPNDGEWLESDELVSPAIARATERAAVRNNQL